MQRGRGRARAANQPLVLEAEDADEHRSVGGLDEPEHEPDHRARRLVVRANLRRALGRALARRQQLLEAVERIGALEQLAGDRRARGGERTQHPQRRQLQPSQPTVEVAEHRLAVLLPHVPRELLGA